MAHLLRYAANQALFASVVGVALLLPTYLSSDGVKGYGGERPDGGSFSRSTIKNIFCRSRAEGRIVGGAGPRHDSVGGRSSVNFFPHCQNGSSEWRFVVVVSGAARTFKCCLASSPRRRHGPRRPFGSKSIWIRVVATTAVAQVACAWVFTLRALQGLAATSRRVATLRHRHLADELASGAQRSFSVVVEDVPPRLRSGAALRKAFEGMCGPGSVHSIAVAVARRRGTP